MCALCPVSEQDLVRLSPIGDNAALVIFRIGDVVEAIRMTWNLCIDNVFVLTLWFAYALACLKY